LDPIDTLLTSLGRLQIRNLTFNVLCFSLPLEPFKLIVSIQFWKRKCRRYDAQRQQGYKDRFKSWEFTHRFSSSLFKRMT